MSRTMQRIWTILFLLIAWLADGADQPLILPDWLATLQEANSVTTSASDASIDLAYLVSLPPHDVIGRYQKQLEKAGVRFTTSFDGIGNTIAASTETISCMVRIAETDSGSRVHVGCAPRIAQPSPQAPDPSVETRTVAAVPGQAVPSRPGAAKNVDGWSKARWGMTQKQVLNAFSGEARVLTDNSLDRNFSWRGIATVGIDSEAIGGIPVRVFFLFDSTGKLDGIRFNESSSSPVNDHYMRMESALAGVYGAPTLRAVQDTRQYPLATVKGFLSAWVLPNSVIYLSYINPTSLLSMDKRTNQTTESIMASWPGFEWFR
jgi:hypothetical protein